jgi:hypothetical protein
MAAARGLPLALRGLERLARGAPAAFRLAALSLARYPGHAAVAVAFFVVSLGLALFAESYRSTLERGQRDQAAYAVPLDFVLTEDPSKLISPLEAAPLSRYRSLGPDIDAVPVLRLSGSVPRLESGRGVSLLGVPAGALLRLDGWRGDFSPLSPAVLAGRIESRGRVELRGPRLPVDGTKLLLPVAAHGDDVVLAATVLSPRGQFVNVDLGETDGARRTVLHARLPPRARGGRLVSLTIGLTLLSRVTTEPLLGVLEVGRLTVGRPRGGRTLLSGYENWIGVEGIEIVRAGATTRLRYFVSHQGTSRFRPRQLSDGKPVPVIASPRLAAAASGGILPVQLVGQQIRAMVVAIARRFPSVERDFVIADRSVLATALNAEDPGTPLFNEVWIGTPATGIGDVEAALRRPPFDALRVESRASHEFDLRSDPVARGTLVTLAAAAAVALALALVGLLLLILSDLRDERGELFGLEAQGAGPSLLRRHIRLRAAFITVVAVVGGVGLGAALAALVVDFVTLTANAAEPEPPLVLEVAWPRLGGAVGAYAVLAAVLVAAPTWTAFRSPAPERVLEEEA